MRMDCIIDVHEIVEVVAVAYDEIRFALCNQVVHHTDDGGIVRADNRT